MADNLNFEAVLFDFSGTLFDYRNVVKSSQVAYLLRQQGVQIDDSKVEKLCEEYLYWADTEAGLKLREKSDYSQENHRSAWLKIAELMEQEVPKGFAEAAYQSLTDTKNWRAYPGVKDVLVKLSDYNIQLAVVSNIGWDIRNSFCTESLFKYFDSFILSCEHGIVKPEPEIFDLACQSLQCDLSDVLMVGDDPTADGGAAAYGIATYILPKVTSNLEARELNKVLNLIGICESLN